MDTVTKSGASIPMGRVRSDFSNKGMECEMR